MPSTSVSSDASKRGQKAVLSFAVLALAVSLIGLGAYAAFTASTSENQSVSAGSMVVELGATGANDLTIAATDIAPGDTIQRAVSVENTGSIDFASLSLTTSAPVTSSFLDTDATDGLQIVIEKCSVAWTDAGGNAYSCGGTTTTVVASSPVIQAATDLGSLASLSAGGVNHLRVTLTFPGTADDTFQGKSSVINYSFDAAQRAGTTK